MARKGTVYKPNRKLNAQLKADMIDVAHAVGSIISSHILKGAQNKIYGKSLPAKYRYRRTHTLAKNIGYVVKGSKGVALIFSNVKYARYLEKLVGRRWQTHYDEADLNVENLKAPSGSRPYANFVPGIISGLKKVKKSGIGGLKWKI